jgi:hypothetical protein
MVVRAAQNAAKAAVLSGAKGINDSLLEEAAAEIRGSNLTA